VTPTAAERFERRYPVLGGGFFLAGRTAGSIKRELADLPIAGELARRVVIAAYEAEMNIVIHAISGELELCADAERVVVVATDRGPGIPDIPRALEPGFSTASEKARSLGFGAGMGLANMQRCADGFDISSTVGEGTRVEMTFLPREPESKEA
jgi:serine/threonine-protein kinase RsbT